MTATAYFFHFCVVVPSFIVFCRQMMFLNRFVPIFKGCCPMLFLASILLTYRQCHRSRERRGGSVWMEEEVGCWGLLVAGYTAIGWFFITGSGSPVRLVLLRFQLFFSSSETIRSLPNRTIDTTSSRLNQLNRPVWFGFQNIGLYQPNNTRIQES